MSALNLCSSCGNQVPGDSVDICPRCILEAVLLDTRSTIGWDDAPNETDKPARPLPEPKQPRYEKGLSISKGGMGEILEARELPVGRQVAMKVIHEAQGGNAEVRARFIEEAQITGQLEHPSIVPMHDLSIDDRGNVFYTMKRVRGQTLGAILVELKEGDTTTLEAYPLSRLLTILQKICDAIAFAHSRGVIHRDLKPENVMVGEFGEVLVMDWGLAKALNLPDFEYTIDRQNSGDKDGEFLHTVEGMVKGTIGFMAPEQAAGIREAIGTPCDIYALGAILYEILTLTRSVQAKSLEDGYEQTIAGQFNSPSEHNKTKQAVHCPGKRIPESLSAVTMRAMAKDPRDRYETVGDLQREIEAYQSGFATDAEEAGFWKRLNFFVKRNKVESIAALIIGVIILASSGFLYQAWRMADEQRAKAVEATGIAEDRADIIMRNLYIAEMNLASEAAANPEGLKRVSELTSNWLPEDGREDLRGWEWYYLTSLLHPDAATLRGHTDEVSSVAYSPDGKTIATASWDKTICFWDAATRKLKSVLRGHEGRILAIAWSPDGTRLASAGKPRTIMIWKIGSAAEPLLLNGHQREVMSLSWNPEGTRLASGSQDRTVRIWDTNSGVELKKYEDGDELIIKGPPHVHWRPQGDLLAITAGGGPCRFVDVKTGKLAKQEGFYTTGFRWSPDGNRFAMASHLLGVWDTSSWNSLVRFPDSGGDTALSWSPDGKFLTTGKLAIHLWEPDTKEKLSVLRGHVAPISSLDWNPNGWELASASEDRTVKIWDLRPVLQPSPSFRDIQVDNISWSPDGLKFAAGTGPGDSSVMIWNAATGQKIRDLPFPSEISGAASRCAWSPAGNLIAGVNRENAFKIWNAESYEEIAKLDPVKSHQKHSNRAQIVWSPDGGRCAYQWNSSQLTVWNAGNDQVVDRIPVGDLRSIAWDPRGQFLATLEGNMIRILETTSWKELRQIREPGVTLLSIGWSPDGNYLATGDSQGGLKIWDPATLRKISNLVGHSAPIEVVTWSREGSRLASGSKDKTIKIWEPENGKQLLSISEDFFTVKDLGWSPDGTCLLGAFYGQGITMWDATKAYALEEERVTAPGALP